MKRWGLRASNLSNRDEVEAGYNLEFTNVTPICYIHYWFQLFLKYISIMAYSLLNNLTCCWINLYYFH